VLDNPVIGFILHDPTRPLGSPVTAPPNSLTRLPGGIGFTRI
jgi:hypothetical protein